jgi:hypothetical protein
LKPVTPRRAGDVEAVWDQGNQHVIAADGSIIDGGKGQVFRLYAP